jgi:hypothetical protein
MLTSVENYVIVSHIFTYGNQYFSNMTVVLYKK